MPGTKNDNVVMTFDRALAHDRNRKW